MSAPTPTEFVSVDGYYTPEDGGLLFSLSPVMAAGVVILLGLALLLGWLWGRRTRPTDDPSEAIYTAIRKALSEATGAPRDAVVATARKAQATLKARLGDVLLLAHGLAEPYDALGPALEGVDDGPPEPAPHKPEPVDRSGLEKLVIKARDVFISSPAAAAHVADGDHGDGHSGHGKDDHGAGHGSHGHGVGRKLDAATQIERVRAAVHTLSDHWSDKPARLAELRAARKQLTRSS
jgi:hypothetical protein